MLHRRTLGGLEQCCGRIGRSAEASIHGGKDVGCRSSIGGEKCLILERIGAQDTFFGGVGMSVGGMGLRGGESSL